MAKKMTDPFREQHETIAGLMSQLRGHLEPGGGAVAEHAPSISRLLTLFSRELKLHLALEDSALYPLLLLAGDDGVKRLAEEYVQEMGDIRERCSSYMDRWSSSFKIAEAPERFVRETHELFGLLDARIEKEDGTLYGIIDQMVGAGAENGTEGT